MNFTTEPTDCQAHGLAQSRRDFLWRSGGGLGGIALAGMPGRDGVPGATHPVGLPHEPKAQRVIPVSMGLTLTPI